MNLISPGNAAAVVAAGLVSVLLFPIAAFALLGERDQPEGATAALAK
jgi:hypothetical protein